MYLKEQYRMTQKEKVQIASLNDVFTGIKNENDLRLYLDNTQGYKKTLPKKYRAQIDDLYFKYLYPLGNIGWFDPFEIELKDLKKDSTSNNSNNKKYWVKTYMLNWMAMLPIIPKTDFFFYSLTSRKSYRLILENVYTK